MTKGKKRSNRARRAQARRQWGRKSAGQKRSWLANRRAKKGRGFFRWGKGS